MNDRDQREALTLEILEAIEARSDLTQRHLASRMGVALGLANSYLKRCVRKGLVKIQQAPANRYLYYLTPKGFAEKSRLTAEYLSYSFDFYRRASQSCTEAVARCAALGFHRVGLYGASDLTEIAILQAMKQGVAVVCVCDASGTGRQFLELPTVESPEQASEVDGWMLTGIEEPWRDLERLEADIGPERVVAPSILGLGHRET